MGVFSNKLLWLAVIFGVIGQVFAIYSSLGQKVFKTVPLGVSDLILVLFCASSGFVVIEALKVIKARFPSTGKFIPIG